MNGLIVFSAGWRRFLYGSAGAFLLCVASACGQEPASEAPPIPGQTAPIASRTAPDALPAVKVTETERAAVAITSTDLDLHLVPAEAREEGHATLIVRNTSANAAVRIPLQISGSLRWLAISVAGARGLGAVVWTQSPISTDTDHTGYAQEALITPAEPLAAGASLTLSVTYAGEIKQSAGRLELLGADPARAAESEWDAIQQTSDAGSTALRGFGEVLWYPVAAPTAGLGDGNRLFELIAAERRRNTAATLRLRLTVEYLGDPPNAAILDGQVIPLEAHPDEVTTLVDETHGVATCEMPMATIGYRTPSLFLTAQNAVATPDQLLSVISPAVEAAEPYAAAADRVQPLLESWFGATPRVPLTVLDHPGAPFEDGSFLAAKLSPNAEPEAIAPALVPGLTHAFVHAPGARAVWLDEGLAEFMSLLWTEKTKGREAALGELRHASLLLALEEPDLTANPAATGQPLVAAVSEVYLRFKAASVLWQLRELLGEEKFRQALLSYRKTAGTAAGDRETEAFERALEKSSGQDLGWFFGDWVYRDRGLPDLTVVRVNARAELSSKSAISGYLVAVEVRNDGDAVADVPVTVRAASASIKDHVRVVAHGSASVRIFFQSRPETVEVNDGSVPEQRTTVHTANITF